jgi:hypothetical protein
VGAEGATAAKGVNEFEADDDELVPKPLVAVIENVYACPCTKVPVYVKGFAVADEVKVKVTDGDDVTV